MRARGLNGGDITQQREREEKREYKFVGERGGGEEERERERQAGKVGGRERGREGGREGEREGGRDLSLSARIFSRASN